MATRLAELKRLDTLVADALAHGREVTLSLHIPPPLTSRYTGSTTMVLTSEHLKSHGKRGCQLPALYSAAIKLHQAGLHYFEAGIGIDGKNYGTFPPDQVKACEEIAEGWVAHHALKDNTITLQHLKRVPAEAFFLIEERLQEMGITLQPREIGPDTYSGEAPEPYTICLADASYEQLLEISIKQQKRGNRRGGGNPPAR